MTTYSGNKSLDAEISLDFNTGEILMDYSLNDKGDPYQSNTSVTIKDDLKELPKKDKAKAYLKATGFVCALVAYGFTAHLLTFLLQHGWIKNKNYQIEHQKILKYLIMNTHGIDQKVFEAPLDTTELKYKLYNNLWFNYQLEGDFQTEIEKIQLKRHFETTKRFGKFEQIKQHGWDLIFTFKTPPQTGKCVIEHT